MNWPSLSVIIPSYNQGHYIERTILSVLKQGYAGDLQLIVSDAGSSDSTVQVLEKYPQITWWSKPDKGFADAVNKALAVATGEIVAIQSSDDYYLQGAFQTAISALVEQPEMGFVTGSDVVVGGKSEHPTFNPLVRRVLANPEDLLKKWGIAQHCTFVRREAINRVDGLREEVDRCADFDLWYRILHFYPGLVLPQYLAAYQKHPAQRGQNKAQAWIDSLRQVLDSCNSDQRYNSRFKLSEYEYTAFMKAMELMWNHHAGGDEGAVLAKQLASEILRDKNRWPEPLQGYAHSLTGKPVSFYVAVRRLGVRTRLRRLLGQESVVASHHAPASEINLDWWKEA